jgi:Leucine-rich repeat (LRR) protein
LITFGTANTGGTTTYSWTNSAPSIGLSASGSGATIPSFTATNTGLTQVVASIVVTPTFTNGGVSCVGPAKTFTITVNPDAVLPVASLKPISCTDNTFSIEISPVVSTTTYTIYQLDNNQVVKAPPHANPLIVSGLHLSQGYRIIATTAAGCKSAPADCGDFTNFDPNAVPAAPVAPENTPVVVESTKAATEPTTVSQVAPVETVKIALASGRSTVTATPNPFSERIRFSIISQVSGQGSLELYTMMGQKVKTVYQGYFEKSVLRTFEYQVPVTERGNLVYLFSIGNQKTSGKLIGIK